VKFSRKGQYLAVGAYDETVRLYNCLTYKQITQLKHKKSLKEKDSLNVFIEEEIVQGGPFNRKCSSAY